MAERISIKLTNANDWVKEALETRTHETGKSTSKYVEDVLVKNLKKLKPETKAKQKHV
jgi:hypothetical protein